MSQDDVTVGDLVVKDQVGKFLFKKYPASSSFFVLEYFES